MQLTVRHTRGRRVGLGVWSREIRAKLALSPLPLSKKLIVTGSELLTKTEQRLALTAIFWPYSAWVARGSHRYIASSEVTPLYFSDCVRKSADAAVSISVR